MRNLEERVRIPALKEALTEIFEEYGNVIDVVAKQNVKAKGQAFIVFDSVDAAERALDEVQGFELFDKPMDLAFARTKSDAIVKMNGTEQDFELHRRHRMAERERKQAQEQQDPQKAKRPAAAEVAPSQPQAKKPVKGAGLKSTGGTAGVIPDEYLPPNKILFLRELPDEADVEMLSQIFSRFDGFKEVRMVPGRKGLAFVEYANQDGAITAKENTAGMSVGDSNKPIRVTFQRQ